MNAKYVHRPIKLGEASMEPKERLQMEIHNSLQKVHRNGVDLNKHSVWGRSTEYFIVIVVGFVIGVGICKIYTTASGGGCDTLPFSNCSACDGNLSLQLS